MNTELKLLIELQEKDAKIDSINDELESLPAEIEELQRQLESEKQSFETFRMEGKQLGLKNKEKEGELAAKEKEIDKFNQELNSIKTNEAYKAMLTQIEEAKKQKSTIEDEILELLESSDQFSKQIKKVESNFKETESTIKRRTEEIQSRISSLKSEVAKLQQERESFIKTIPEQPLKVYEYVRDGKDGMAIVPIQDETSCSGCHYKLPPQKINDAAKMKELIFCDNCARIVYYVKESVKSGDTQ